MVYEQLGYMSAAIDLCYARSLIDEEFSMLRNFNKFRNKIGHPEVYD